MTPRIKMAERRLRLLILDLKVGDATINEVFDAMDDYIDRVEVYGKLEKVGDATINEVFDAMDDYIDRVEVYGKLEIDTLVEKYCTGNYIAVYFSEDEQIWKRSDQDYHTNYRESDSKTILIHKKHEEILDASLDNKDVEIQFLYAEQTNSWVKVSHFIEQYNETNKYRLKFPFPIFKRNEHGEVFKYTSYKNNECMLSEFGNLYEGIPARLDNEFLETIPYDPIRGLYHLQPVWCWDNNYGYISLQFYYTDDKQEYDNIIPVSIEQLKTMSFIWDMYQKVIASE